MHGLSIRGELVVFHKYFYHSTIITSFTTFNNKYDSQPHDKNYLTDLMYPQFFESVNSATFAEKSFNTNMLLQYIHCCYQKPKITKAFSNHCITKLSQAQTLRHSFSQPMERRIKTHQIPGKLLSIMKISKHVLQEKSKVA